MSETPARQDKIHYSWDDYEAYVSQFRNDIGLCYPNLRWGLLRLRQLLVGLELSGAMGQ